MMFVSVGRKRSLIQRQLIKGQVALNKNTPYNVSPGFH